MAIFVTNMKSQDSRRANRGRCRRRIGLGGPTAARRPAHVRWFDPTVGRWLSEDPAGLAPDSNPYRYCGNGPTNGTDPSGMAKPAPSAIDWLAFIDQYRSQSQSQSQPTFAMGSGTGGPQGLLEGMYVGPGNSQPGPAQSGPGYAPVLGAGGVAATMVETLRKEGVELSEEGFKNYMKSGNLDRNAINRIRDALKRECTALWQQWKRAEKFAKVRPTGGLRGGRLPGGRGAGCIGVPSPALPILYMIEIQIRSWLNGTSTEQELQRDVDELPDVLIIPGLMIPVGKTRGLRA